MGAQKGENSPGDVRRSLVCPALWLSAGARVAHGEVPRFGGCCLRRSPCCPGSCSSACEQQGFVAAWFCERWGGDAGASGGARAVLWHVLVLDEDSPGHCPLLCPTLPCVSSFPSWKTTSSAHTNEPHRGTRRFGG